MRVIPLVPRDCKLELEELGAVRERKIIAGAVWGGLTLKCVTLSPESSTTDLSTRFGAIILGHQG